MEEGGSHGRDQAAAKAKPKKKSEAEVRVELVQAQRHHRELGKAIVHLPLDAAPAGRKSFGSFQTAWLLKVGLGPVSQVGRLL